MMNQQPAPRRQMSITPQRREVFLKTLAETASVSAAAAAASPHATGPEAGRRSFYELRARDPEFAAAWQAALDSALAAIEQEIHRRAMEPARSPIPNPKDGSILGYREDRMSADRMLLRLASRLDPNWSEARRLSVDGKVEHRHETGEHLQLSISDLQYLDRDQQEQLIELLDIIRQAKDPKQIEADVQEIPNE